MRVSSNRIVSLLIAGAFMLPGLALATPMCSTGSLASVISLGVCTIGSATFDFTVPALGPNAWLNPIFAGDSLAGPASSAVIFTPETTANTAGFNLTGDFSVNGSPYSYIPSHGNFRPGNYMDIQFGYVKVLTDPGVSIVGVGLDMGNPLVSTDDPNNLAAVNDAGHVSVYSDGVTPHLSDSAALAPGNLLWDLLFVRTWDYSGNPQSTAGFTDFTYTVNLQSSTNGDGNGAVPEPAMLSLIGLGLVAIANLRRRRNKG